MQQPDLDPFRSEPPAATLGTHRKHCYACANILDARAELCPRCGVRQPSLAAPSAPVMVPVHVAALAPPSSKSKTSAALLAFFLGGLGVHKFYLGQTGAGIVYLLFCWTFIPALVAFVEFLILLGMSDAEFNRKHP